MQYIRTSERLLQAFSILKLCHTSQKTDINYIFTSFPSFSAVPTEIRQRSTSFRQRLKKRAENTTEIRSGEKAKRFVGKYKHGNKKIVTACI